MENDFKKLVKEKELQPAAVSFAEANLEEVAVVKCPYCSGKAHKFRNYAQRYMCVACKRKFWKSDLK